MLHPHPRNQTSYDFRSLAVLGACSTISASLNAFWRGESIQVAQVLAHVLESILTRQ